MAVRRSSKFTEVDSHDDASLDDTTQEVEQRNTESYRTRHYTVTKEGTKEIRSMSMIDPTQWSLEDSQEPYALKDGSEVMLRIVDVRLDKRADETEYYTVRFEVVDEPYSKEITDWFNVPARSLDPKRLNAARRKMLHLMESFGIDTMNLTDPVEDWPGYEGWCILSLSKSEQYGEQNRIAQFIRPR